ncbi:hypothetical protein SETIT_7G201200v2 [Setaria italica]|uniref:Uncharacterized protein n=1 Tax=Setaria italica TaxID=4555 RepID=A0A368RXT2_SETIT|nr:hypothetical protein SETIT_7G201200v2 [Setaria italica]
MDRWYSLGLLVSYDRVARTGTRKRGDPITNRNVLGPWGEQQGEGARLSTSDTPGPRCRLRLKPLISPTNPTGGVAPEAVPANSPPPGPTTWRGGGGGGHAGGEHPASSSSAAAVERGRHYIPALPLRSHPAPPPGEPAQICCSSPADSVGVWLSVAFDRSGGGLLRCGGVGARIDEFQWVLADLVGSVGRFGRF